ncbi:MAG: CUAEP/CCAEP-tail radical SAM (seleno)protein [Deltaproteobacteria bacterium]
MRAPGAICLLSFYELGHSPMGIASPAGFLRRAGFSPSALDLAVEPFDSARLSRAKLVIASVPMHTALRLALAALPELRRAAPNAHLCFHGLYAQLERDLLFARGVHSIASGEAEAALVALARALDGGGPLEAVEGLSLPGRPAAPVLERLELAVPDRSALPLAPGYAKLRLASGETRPAGHVEASRGCKHVCAHCPVTPVYRGRFFVVPQEIVLADVAAQVATGARHVTFGDPDFWNGPGHASAVVRELHRRWPDLTYDVTVKVEHLLRRPDGLRELAETGCAFVTSAFESTSDLTLTALRKGHTAADLERALDLAEAAQLALRPTFVAFTPWTTAADYGSMLRLIERRDLVSALDPVQLTLRLLVPPGSLLLEGVIPGLGSLDPETLSYAWRHPDPRMDELQRQLSADLDGSTPAEPFLERAWALAQTLLGIERPATPPRHKRRASAPSLTESWFC